MKPLLHIYVIPKQQDPPPPTPSFTSSHLPPTHSFLRSFSSLLFQMQNKHQPSLLLCFRAHQPRIGAEFISGFFGTLNTQVFAKKTDAVLADLGEIDTWVILYPLSTVESVKSVNEGFSLTRLFNKKYELTISVPVDAEFLYWDLFRLSLKN